MRAAQPQDEGQQPKVSDSNRQRDTREGDGDSTEQPAAHELDHSDNMATGDFDLEQVDVETPTVGADFDHSDAMVTGECQPEGAADDEDDFVLRSGVFHLEGEAVEEGPAVDLSEFKFDEAVLAAIEGPQEFAVEVPRKPERNFTIVDEDLLSGFRDLEYVGHGSFGVVLKATDTLGREVAIKILTSEREEEAQRFTNEAKITAQLGASGPDTIVKIYERDTVSIIDAAGHERKAPFTTMEFVDRSLSGTIKELEALRAEGEKAEYMSTLGNALGRHLVGACRGIDHAHQKGILHRDIKPDNIATSTAELGERTRVLDWGLGKRITDTDDFSATDTAEIDTSSIKDLMTFYTQSGSIVGSPPFMSPEQADPDRSEDPRSDVFALGATMYEILTGEFPHKGTDGVNIVLSKIEGSAELKPIADLNPWAPRPLRLIVEKAMAEDPAARYQTAEEMAQDIERYYNNQQVTASELLQLGERLKERVGLFLQRHQKPLAVATLIVSSVVPVSVWGLSKSAENARANDRAAAVSTVLDDVEALPVTDADFGIRQIDQMLQKVAGEEHETVLAVVADLEEKRSELVDFVEYREAERAKYETFVRQSNEILGSMTFAFRDPLGRFDSTHERIENLLDQFGAKDDASWKEKLDERVFSETEIENIKKSVFELQVAAVLRVLPIADANLENRVALGDEANRARRARAAEPFIERAKRELGDGETSFALNWAEAAADSLKEGNDYPSLLDLELRTEQDYSLACWVKLYVEQDVQSALNMSAAGLVHFDESGLLYLYRAQAYMTLRMNDLAAESVAMAERYNDRTPAILAVKVIAMGDLVEPDLSRSPAVFKERIESYLSLANEAVDAAIDSSPALRYEVHARRMSGALSALSNLGEQFREYDDEEFKEKLLKIGKQDLQVLKTIGFEYMDLEQVHRNGARFAFVGAFAEATEFLSILDRTIQRFNREGHIGRVFFWAAVNGVAGEAKRQNKSLQLEQLEDLHSRALREMADSFDEAALLEHCVNATFQRAEMGPYGPEYARVLTARSTELGITSSKPVVPNVDPAPFNRLTFRNDKGRALIASYPGGLRWVEQISLQGGGKEAYFFTQVGVEGAVVFLHDRTRNMWLKVSEAGVYFSKSVDDDWHLGYRGALDKR